MRMGLVMAPAQRIYIECRTCGGSMDDHRHEVVATDGGLVKVGCPTAALKHLWENKEPSHCCPLCHSDTIEYNSDNLYECRKCGEQFKSAHTFDDMEAIVDDDRLNMRRDNGLIEKVVAVGQGKADFRYDRDVARLRVMERAWQRRRRCQ